MSTTIQQLALLQGHVLSRSQLYDAGVTRGEIRNHVRLGRWQTIGDQSVCLHNADVSPVGHRWAALFQGGPRACLDGASALIASGLDRFDEPQVRVSVPRGARVRRTDLYDIRQTRRWSERDVITVGIRRTRPQVAAVRAALWAKTDRQATYLLSLTVQQGLATAEQIGVELLRVKRDRRRLLLHQVVNDLLGGARSLGELHMVAECRRRGIPGPRQQVLRRDGHGRYYLDFYWPEFKLVVEIDGIHHAWAENVVGDALRQNALALDGDIVLRFPLLGLRLQPDAFFGQIEDALVAAGWRAAA